ncbi:MAG: hypothetical protein JNL97_09865 [Verrucomicrobiales bacterium]|nr:hypothetical protein [Verrucomicrobiales bacterium]
MSTTNAGMVLALLVSADPWGTARAVPADAPAGARAPQDAPAATAPTKASGGRSIGWAQLESAEYPAYLDRLRAAGCPEVRVRLIVTADADEWLLQQRISQAVANDFAWWKAEPVTGAGETLNDKYEQFRKRRNEWVRKLLGDAPEEPAEAGTETPIVVNLSGPVLGALPREKFNAVQEICARSLDRHQGYYNTRQNEGIFLNQGDLARLREQTRTDLAVVLSAEELEEFLLRYSHNANRLRTELAALEPTPDEFRTIFRAVDALEHRLQLEFGAVDSLSARQREDFERQREEAIRTVLPADRYQRYLVGRYPLFRQAQLAVRRAGLADTLALPFYEVLNQHESRRREVLNNSALNADQRQLALQDIEKSKEAAIRKALGEDGYRQYRDSLVN